MKNRAHRFALLSSLVLLAPVVGGCISQRPAINRVQPDYLDKKDFIPNQYAALTSGDTPQTITPTMLAKEPVFYTQTTMIAKPTSIGFTGLTSYSESDKVRWDVTEHFLIARQSYEFVKNAPTGTQGIGDNVQTGDPVAVFAISSHFDIKHAYNTTTGEELNVLEENSTDRPWYLRQYMHVDFSQNMVTGYNSVLSEAVLEGRVLAEPSPIYITNPSDPNAPVFEWTGADDAKKLTYFDVVVKSILHPETTMLSYSDHPGSTTTYTNLPVCYLNQYESSMDCAPAEVTLRLAFRRADPKRDYEPAPVNVPIPNTTLSNQSTFQHLDMERFGFFDQARVGYDPVQHATLDDYRMHFASRHNMWVHHHQLAFGAPNGKGCNFDADCSADGTLLCKIGNDPVDASHRGQCAALATVHDVSDLKCFTDDDCLQTINNGGQSMTAFCDTGTHTCAEHYIRCSVDTDCSTVDGNHPYGDKNSTCDLAIAYTRADNRGLCLMPFLQRQVRPIAYHESGGANGASAYPEYMQPVTERIVYEWNDAFRTAVSAARRHECELNAGIDGSSADPNGKCNSPQVLGLDPALGADAQFVYVACHSPVWGTATGDGQHSQADVDAAHAKGWDLPACGPQGTIARIGDMRYSMIGAITDHDTQGYWGLANIASDPETGEMVVGRGAVWQTITDTYASYLVTLVQLLNGAIDPATVSDGDYILNSMKQLGAGQTPANEILDVPLRQPGALERISAMKTGIDQLRLPDAGWLTTSTPLFSNSNSQPGAMLTGQNRILGARILGDGTANGSARLSSLAGTQIESLLMNQEQTMLADTASPDPTAQLPQTLSEASPMRTQSSAMRRVLNSLHAKLQAWECEYDSMFSDDMLLGLAQRLAQGAPIKASDPLDGPIAFGRDWDFSQGGAAGQPNWSLMTQWAAQFIHHGVLAHELGHSLGQRHNFTASADAINYFDQYWLVRGKGHATKPGDVLPGIRPRYTYLADAADGNYYSPEEIAGRVDEYSYSSVMDYKGLNEDAHGLGRYDYAFIKNGYVGMVEAFKNVPDVTAATVYGVNMGGTGLSTPLDLRDWSTGGGHGQAHGVHYTQMGTFFGMKMGSDGATMVPNVGDDNRYNVFLRETCGLSGNPPCADIPGFGPPSFSNVTSDGAHALVPYRFDTDERAGLIWQVQRYDAGADAFESLHYVTERVLNYYFANSYARLRSGFSTKGYVNRIWGRYMEQLHQCTQTLAFDLINFQDFLDSKQDDATWLKYKNDPAQFGGFVNQTVMSMSADTITGLLTMPAMGYHDNRAQFDKSPLVQPIQSGSYITQIPINEGRAFESSWRNDVGFFWYNELNTAGSYYDKVMAIQALTDPDLLLLQRDTPTDIRLFELSYYTMFPSQMIRLFGGILSEDYQDYAPIVDLNKTTQTDISLARTHVATLNLPPGPGVNQSGRVLDTRHVPIDPQDHFTIQLWAAVHGISQFPATYDQRYADYSRLWIDGSIEAVQVQDPADNTVFFTDPFSFQTYRALHFSALPGQPGADVGASPQVHLATGKVADEAGVAARAILHAQDLEAARQAAIKSGVAYDISVATQQEQQYINLLSAMRAVSAQFAHGFANEP